MSQFPSPSSPQRPDSDSGSPANSPLDLFLNQPNSGASEAPDAEAISADAPRRLISPRERFAPAPVENFDDVWAEEEIAPKTVVSSRLDEEMARRHLPPRERRRHERARIQREGREQKRRFAQEHSKHSHHSAPETARARAEREFALGARENPPIEAPKRRRIPLFLKRILWLVALIFVGQVGFAAFTAPQFEIKGVEIQGLSATPSDAVSPLARRLLGQNILRANRANVENAVRRVPTVADAHVVRLVNWPPKVALQVTERQPFLKAGAGQNWWIIDPTGVAFRRPTSEDAALYSVVAPQFSPELSQKLQTKTWTSARALNAAIHRDNELAQGKTSAETSGDAQKSPFWQLRRIYFDTDGLASLRVTRASHREMLIRLGDDSWPEKLARARVALAYFERTGRRAAELDLVSLERPVWTPIVDPSSVKATLTNG